MWLVYLFYLLIILFLHGHLAKERALGLKFRHNWVWNPPAGGGLGQVPSCVEPQRPHLLDGDDDSTSLWKGGCDEE